MTLLFLSLRVLRVFFFAFFAWNKYIHAKFKKRKIRKEEVLPILQTKGNTHLVSETLH